LFFLVILPLFIRTLRHAFFTARISISQKPFANNRLQHFSLLLVSYTLLRLLHIKQRFVAQCFPKMFFASWRIFIPFGRFSYFSLLTTY